MRPRRLTVLMIAAIGLAFPGCPDGYGGWGAGGCAPVGVTVFQAAPPVAWIKTPGVEEIALFLDGRQVGAVEKASGLYYRRLAPGVWDGPCAAPVPLPAGVVKAKADGELPCECYSKCRCPEKKCDCNKKNGRCGLGCNCNRKIGNAESQGGLLPLPRVNYGVDQSKIAPQERYSINGRPVTEAQAEKALAGPEGKLTDDSSKLSLTIIGSDAERKQALTDLAAPALATFREHVVVQDYSPDSPMLACGFATDGHPTVYLQKPDGTVLAHTDQYNGSATWEAIRKKDPSYDPAKDVDPAAPAAPLTVNGEPSVIPFLGAAAAVVVGFALIRKVKT